MANGLGPGSTEDTVRRRAVEGQALPYARAYVVQFTAETDARLEHVAGRIEPLQTGRQSHFTSVAQLLACFVPLLAEESE
jgi:hypothetical protein